MYNIGDIFYYDDEYIKRADYCNENELKIIEYGKDDNGKMRYTIAPLYTQEELDEIKKEKRIFEIKSRLDSLTQDFIQMQCGAIFEDEMERKIEFQKLHNELRELLNKTPREYSQILQTEV